MRIAVVGRTGQLARSLASAETAHELVFLGREAIDLTDPAGAEAAIAAAAPDLVVNAAAYTAVDRAESEPDLARAVNAAGVAALARGAARANAGLVHISTDYVFNGARTGEWAPDDPTGPLGVYGATKLEGERAARAANPRTAIVRTSWVHSPYGANFVKTMLRLADRERLTVVSDQIGKPTSALDLADAILAIAPRLDAPEGAPVWGAHHYAGAGAVSWADFAREIFAQAVALGMIARAPDVAPIPTADYPTPAARPANSALDCSGFERIFNLAMIPWRDGLARVLMRLNAEGQPKNEGSTT